jgi:hypothetical protein
VITNNRKTHTVLLPDVRWSSIVFHCLFLYINDMPKIPINKAKIILYAVETSVIASNPSSQEFNVNINKSICRHKWEVKNKLSTN